MPSWTRCRTFILVTKPVLIGRLLNYLSVNLVGGVISLGKTVADGNSYSICLDLFCPLPQCLPSIQAHYNTIYFALPKQMTQAGWSLSNTIRRDITYRLFIDSTLL